MINPKDLIDLENSPILSEDEVVIKKELEKFIDREIRANFNGGSSYVSEFEYRYDLGINKLKSVRRRVVKESLFKDYRKNGWEIKYDPGEDDGPNRPAIGSYIFKAESR